MIPFLNNLYSILLTQNEVLTNLILIPACFIESAIVYNMILMFLGVHLKKKKNILYTACVAIVGVITLRFIPEPFNYIINSTFLLILLTYILKLNFFKSLASTIFALFIIALTNMLILKPYQLILNIDNYVALNTPLYRIGYLIIFYMIICVIYIIIKKLVKIKISFDFFDVLDKKTKAIIYTYIFATLLGLFVQLLITAFYMDVVPIIISIFNFFLMLLLLILSVYTFSRIMSLENTKQNLQTEKEYNKSLEILYDEVKGFNHDFKNIISSIDGYIETNNITKLKEYINEVKEDCRITNNLSILNPRIINNPGIYSLLNNKYFKAINAGIKFDLYFLLDLSTLKINQYKFSRILGVLLDNAIEEAEKCKEKIIKVSFKREEKNKRAIILIENTYTNKNVNIEDIFKKGYSGKQNHSGIGLWEVRKYIKSSKNLDLFTSKNDKFFKQELTVYDMN
mgnify:FL=1